jgi:GxxExxY protein
MKEIVNNKYVHSELTGTIIGCAMTVHNALGKGFQEFIYQRCLAIEMNKHHLTFARELEMSIYYDGIKVGKRRVDFLVEDNVMVELKAVPEIQGAHISQTLNYLEAYKLQTGLFINFGASSLQFKRLTIEQNLKSLKT